MAWSGSLTEASAVGSAITFTPEGVGYSVDAFTAPRKGIYRFTLKGSGGALVRTWSTAGTPGKGGLTVGYLLLEKGQTVYVGAGDTCRAGFVSKTTGAALKNIAKEDLFFVAGAGGGNGNGDRGVGADGGNGGGETGANGSTYAGYTGYGGTQTKGGQGNGGYDADKQGAYGVGGNGFYVNVENQSRWGGAGGDGYYGGGSGGAWNGGGGGSGYIHTDTLKVNTKTFTNVTQQGGGASGNNRGSVQVSYHARAELPIKFNGATIERLIYNGVEIESLIYDGVRLFMRRLRECLNLAEPVFA
jgi:hypothetical protein